MIEFARIWALLMLPLPLAAWCLLPPKPSRGALQVPDSVVQRLEAIAGSRQHPTLFGQQSYFVRLLGWCALIIALAGPQTKGAELIASSGRDLVLAIDFSASMGAKDIPTSAGKADRISVARDLIGQFTNRLSGDRVGLVAFASEAFVVAPLTHDHQAVSQMINELTIGLPGRKTDLGRAIGITVKLFLDTPKSERYLVIISDGETNSGGLSAIDATALAREEGIIIHMIGFAETVDASSEQHMREIAEMSGGSYNLASTPEDLRQALHNIRNIAVPALRGGSDFLVRDWTWLFLLLALSAAAYVAWREARYG